MQIYGILRICTFLGKLNSETQIRNSIVWIVFYLIYWNKYLSVKVFLQVTELSFKVI